jgi:hypothetical protein
MWISLSSLRQLVMGSAGMGSLLLGMPSVWADCPDCQRQSFPPAAAYSPTPEPMTMDSPTWDQSLPNEPSPVPFESSEHPGFSTWDQSRQYHAPPPVQPNLKPALAVVPPPGTLGQTYLRQSWPIPKAEHPRTAIIQVSAPGFTLMQVDGLTDLDGFQRPDGAWIFKTKQPLTPGVPHIYQVKAGYKNTEDPQWNVRTVRLIPGRVVTLEY